MIQSKKVTADEGIARKKINAGMAMEEDTNESGSLGGPMRDLYAYECMDY